MKNLLILYLVSVEAGVNYHLVCRWLDRYTIRNYPKTARDSLPRSGTTCCSRWFFYNKREPPHKRKLPVGGYEIFFCFKEVKLAWRRLD